MIGDYVGGEPQLCEPHKCAGWQWFEWDNLPETLMVSMINLQASGYSPLQ
jgi:8-oxo-dGTP diphosphatase